MNQETHTDAWSFFDRIYCITLKGRDDRRETVQRQFARVGITDRVRYMVVEKHPTHSEQGIYESHLRCLRDGLEAGANRMMVFEDDVIFEGFDRQRFRQGLTYLEEHPDWSLFFLGCLVKGSRPTASAAVRSIRYSSLAHAYAINRPCAQQVVEKPWQNIPFDVMLANLDGTPYALCPTAAFQSDAASDNDRRRMLERFRRCCGGLRRIQKVNDWYHRNKPLVVVLHLVVLALALLFWKMV